MSVLVIAAHPDDEVLGCGATVSKLANEGVEVNILILGEGITSRYEKREDAPSDLIEELKEKAEKAKEELGASKLFLLDLPDNRFDTVPLLDIVKKIEKVIDEVKPVSVFTHHKGDLNSDHTITHRAVLIATRPTAACPVKQLHTFEVPSSTDWAFGEFGAFNPNTFFDVSTTIASKIKAMEIYDTEIIDFPHPRSAEALTAIARRWGSVAGLESAEAFQTVRQVLK
jgi:LmbE family N-acetylglucosaminyl deacetylase